MSDRSRRKFGIKWTLIHDSWPLAWITRTHTTRVLCNQSQTKTCCLSSPQEGAYLPGPGAEAGSGTGDAPPNAQDYPAPVGGKPAMVVGPTLMPVAGGGNKAIISPPTTPVAGHHPGGGGAEARPLNRITRALLVHPLNLLTITAIADPHPAFRSYATADRYIRWGGRYLRYFRGDDRLALWPTLRQESFSSAVPPGARD
jgi:hypothetical protein